ncbi:MAG: hypothetical protein IKO06_04495, partial [Alphaproteobacteria bacterium]|nr:hypothetical protein [Alphaproteobacteria bacterium]
LAECYASEGGSGDSSAPTNSYTYDDEGRIKEITYAYGDGSFITTINYNQDGSITGTQRYTGGGYGDAYHGATYTVDAIRTGGTDDNPLYTIKDANYGNSIEQNDNVPDGSTYALIIDKNGQIVQEGTLYSNGYSAAGWAGINLYGTDDSGNKTRTIYSCSYANQLNSYCSTQVPTQTYTQITDDLGNVVAEIIGDQVVAEYNYSDNYIAKQETQRDAECSESGNCTKCYSGVVQGGKCVASCGASFRLNDGECDRIRYTPAEAAEVLKDTDNQIIMTFKVNR